MKSALCNRIVSVSSIIVLATLFVISGAGQQRDKPKLAKPGDPSQDQKPKDDQDVVHIGTDLVLLDVTVVDQNNRPVMDLNREQFDVLEDKVPQKIEFFSREQAPVSLVFVIDASGSMRPKLDTVIKASVNLVKESKLGDEMAVIQFKDQPELLEEFTGDVNDVTDALQGIIASRQTAMLDALYLSADYASKEGKNRKKAVILVTDGLDNNSYYKFDEVVSHLRETDVQIYFIGFISDLSADHGLFNRSEKDKAENLLNKLAADTGGKAFYPRELADVHSIAQQISTDLRTQYSIGYYPTNSKRDGTFRAVKVGITGGGNRRLVARTRTGYTAPKEGDRRSASK
jgi:Ca-activated chloride channel family protein